MQTLGGELQAVADSVHCRLLMGTDFREESSTVPGCLLVSASLAQNFENHGMLGWMVGGISGRRPVLERLAGATRQGLVCVHAVEKTT